ACCTSLSLRTVMRALRGHQDRVPQWPYSVALIPHLETKMLRQLLKTNCRHFHLLFTRICYSDVLLSGIFITFVYSILILVRDHSILILVRANYFWIIIELIVY